MKGYQYYAERIVGNAVDDPSVDATDAEAMDEYAREVADLLCLDPDNVAAHVKAHNPMTQAVDTTSVDAPRGFQ